MGAALHSRSFDYNLNVCYERAGYSCGQQLTRSQAQDLLNFMRASNPEMRDLYPEPGSMLDEAELNSKDNWYYRIRPED